MDDIDRKICGLIQEDGRSTSAEIAERVGVSVSTAHDRVRRLVSNGTVLGFRAVLNSRAVGADFCCFLFIDMAYDGEQEAIESLSKHPAVLELHHISGPHSYLMKIRVPDAAAVQRFLQEVVKPLRAIQRTETLFSLDVAKETAVLNVAGDAASL